ncbi:preprotein translocase subunit SecG [Aliifodinibius salipaludis]|uniref:Protein-export membrane protein SecG n=1 Tax=Fodinibius salipaludis TaxID=2032627 RepID=A0A2A2GEB9_9BACT|nr:preprotein translocase subunit SecG [Aliifodinibius salipaludis]PAU95334.1 preprotein translocase subunit SecG [Aliifodinibius salipaludis]
MLYTIILSVITIICILLVIVILLQPGQGQGISGGLAGGQAGGQGLGARRTADLLSKSTTVLGAALLALSVLANFAIEREGASESAVQQSGVEAPAQQGNGMDATQSPSAVPELPQNQGGNGGNDDGGSGDGN